MKQVLRMPRPRPTREELQDNLAEAILQYERHELRRSVMMYFVMAVLVAIGMLAEYLLLHL